MRLSGEELVYNRRANSEVPQLNGHSKVLDHIGLGTI